MYISLLDPQNHVLNVSMLYKHDFLNMSACPMQIQRPAGRFRSIIDKAGYFELTVVSDTFFLVCFMYK